MSRRLVWQVQSLFIVKFGTVLAVPRERHEVSEVGRVSMKARPTLNVRVRRVRPFEKLRAAIL